MNEFKTYRDSEGKLVHEPGYHVLDEGTYELKETLHIRKVTELVGYTSRGPSSVGGTEIVGNFDGPLVHFQGMKGDAAEGAGGGLVDLRMHNVFGPAVHVTGQSDSWRPSWVNFGGVHFIDSNILLDGVNLSADLRNIVFDRCRLQNATLRAVNTANLQILGTMFHRESTCLVESSTSTVIRNSQGFYFTFQQVENLILDLNMAVSLEIHSCKWINGQVGLLTYQAALGRNRHYTVKGVCREDRNIFHHTDLLT